MSGKKVGLIILDGWGHGDKTKSDAIHNANTPFIDSLYDGFPNAELLTDGVNVGLPEGQMGNSEVGHLNIGAGRIVYQDLAKINKAVSDGTLAHNPVLAQAITYAEENNKAVHLMGLVSDGGVHSSQEHLHALCDILQKTDVKKVFIHAFTDGRDTDPNGAVNYISKLEEHLKTSAGTLVSIIGRYYAMDRDNRWERVRLAYDLLVSGLGQGAIDMVKSVNASYRNGITDEFIRPVVKVNNSGHAVGRIEEDDVVLCFNFRTDRCREITQMLSQEDNIDQRTKKLKLHYYTMTNYSKSFEGVNVLFEKDDLKQTLGEVIAANNLSQIRIAETEKYPHVTFFFSGGRESAFEGEKRLLVNSPQVATYDLRPEMSSNEVTQTVVSELKKAEADFICLNFANPDMVGHTGVYTAIVKAVEQIDGCAKKVIEAGREAGYSFIVIADHGNADFAINDNGSPNTAHTTNPVPIFLVDDDHRGIRNGILADVAPTVLKLMGLPQPPEMSGRSLV